MRRDDDVGEEDAHVTLRIKYSETKIGICSRSGDRSGRVARPAADPSQATGRVKRRDNQRHRARVLEVRIQSPPAESLQTFGSRSRRPADYRTRLSGSCKTFSNVPLPDFSRTRFRPAKRAKPLGQRAAQVEHIRATSMRAGRKARTLPKAYLRISRAEARRARFRSHPPRYPRRPCHNPSPRDAAYPLGRAATLHEPTVEHGWLAPGSGLRGP
jgi:hypothetical protein